MARFAGSEREVFEKIFTDLALECDLQDVSIDKSRAVSSRLCK